MGVITYFRGEGDHSDVQAQDAGVSQADLEQRTGQPSIREPMLGTVAWQSGQPQRVRTEYVHGVAQRPKLQVQHDKQEEVHGFRFPTPPQLNQKPIGKDAAEVSSTMTRGRKKGGDKDDGGNKQGQTDKK